MPTAVGPNTKGEENLVFGYDLGDVSNSHKGEPTTNFMPTVYQAGATSSGTDEIGDYFEGTITRIGCPNVTSIDSGATYTFSIEIRADKTFNMSADSNQYAPENAGNDANRVSVSYIRPNYTTPGKWVKYSTTVVVKSGLTNPYMFDFFIPQSFTGRMYYRNAQLEYKPHATPFTPSGTTRSATEGLKDLTGNSTIDLTNVSFDSDAQMTFDATNDRIVTSIPNLPTGAAPRTVTAIVRVVGTSSHYYGITGYGVSSAAQSFDLGFREDGDTVFLDIYGAGGISSTNSITRNEWFEITGVYTGTQLQLYLNGELEASNTYAINTASSNFLIGDTAWGYPLHMNGDIASVKIYNKALTASEIKSNFNAIKGRFNI